MRRAIRHEIEHIARFDWLTQVVARLACVVYWPHPFVWKLWGQLRLEAERACDDAVIRGGVAAEPYAEQLVALARRLVGRGEVPALAMATRSNLGQRVEAILDRGLRRGRITRAASVGVALVAAAFLVAVAPLHVMAAALDDDDDTRVLVNKMREAGDDDENPLDMALLKASARGNLEAMRSLIARGAKANAAISGDGSPLIAAAGAGQVEAIELLLQSGADPNRGVRGDGSPLIAAAHGGYLDAVRLLLERGAEIDLGIQGDGNALIMAAGAGHVDVIAYLLERGASIEKVVPGDENALIHASETGQPESVRLLISRGANVNARVWADFGDGDHVTGEWRTPLSMARRNGHEDVVRILVAAGAKQ